MVPDSGQVRSGEIGDRAHRGAPEAALGEQTFSRIQELGAGELEVPPSRITLICIGEYLGIAHFGGLGELSSDQLARLPSMAATTLTDVGLEHATRAWAALRAPDPAGLGLIATTAVPQLRGL